MSNYLVDIDSVWEHFPPEFPPPRLLLDFAEWLRNCEGSIGCPKFWAVRMCDFWGGGAELHKYLVPFIRDSCGSEVAFWFPDGIPMDDPPVVLVGSEGEKALLGNSLEDFLQRLATRKTGADELDYRHEGEIDAGPSLLAWLKKHRRPSQRRKRILPDYVAWINDMIKRHEDWANQDPILLRLGDEFRSLARPPAGDDWWAAGFEVVIVGSFFLATGDRKLRTNYVIEPLLRADRVRRAAMTPERGLWFSASVSVMRDGPAYLRCEYLEEPRVPDDVNIPSAEYRADLRIFRRSDYWTPAWLKKKLRASTS